MHGVIDILQAIKQHGALSFDDLEAEAATVSAHHTLWFGLALDACIDQGLLRRAWVRGTPLASDRYRLTEDGHRFLRAPGAVAA